MVSMESDKILSYTIGQIFEQIWMSKNSNNKVQSFTYKTIIKTLKTKGLQMQQYPKIFIVTVFFHLW